MRRRTLNEAFKLIRRSEKGYRVYRINSGVCVAERVDSPMDKVLRQQLKKEIGVFDRNTMAEDFLRAYSCR